MTNIHNPLRLALGIVPGIIDLAKSIGIKGSGPAKAAAVVELVKAAPALVPAELVKLVGLSKVEAFVRKVVDIFVAFANSVGLFSTSRA